MHNNACFLYSKSTVWVYYDFNLAPDWSGKRLVWRASSATPEILPSRHEYSAHSITSHAIGSKGSADRSDVGYCFIVTTTLYSFTFNFTLSNTTVLNTLLPCLVQFLSMTAARRAIFLSWLLYTISTNEDQGDPHICACHLCVWIVLQCLGNELYLKKWMLPCTHSFQVKSASSVSVCV